MAPRSSWWLVSGTAVALILGSCANAPTLGETSATPDMAATAPTPPTSIPGSAPSDEGWTHLEDPPLSPRRNAYAFAFGPTVVVAGGSDAKPCPPNAFCAWQEHLLTDGAAYDTATTSWAPIAVAPAPLGLGTSAVSGRTAYIWSRGDPPNLDGSTATFLSYDIVDDRWLVLPRPSRIPGSSFLLAPVPGGVVAYAPTDEAGGPDYWYDAGQAAWRELPDDPLGPSFDRAMAFAGDVLVLLAPELVPQPNSDRPALLRVAVFEPSTWSWRRIADSEILAGDPSWYAVGDRVVNPSMASSDGGQANGWGRDYPSGGILDPGTGAWEALPATPPACGCYGGATAGSGRFLLNWQGGVLDMAKRSWSSLPKPHGAADEGQAVAWADDRLFLFGGDIYAQASAAGDQEARLLDDAWLWSPVGP